MSPPIGSPPPGPESPAGTPSTPLAPKQQRFVEEYPADLNATHAAIRAGYSPKTADVQGSRLLANAKVAAAIAAALAVRAERAGFTAEEVLRELGRLVRSDVRDFVLGENGELQLREGAPDEAWRAVGSVKYTTRTIYSRDPDEPPEVVRTAEIKLWDKNSAVDKAMKHLGISGVEKVEHTGKDGAPLPPSNITIRWVKPRAGKARG